MLSETVGGLGFVQWVVTVCPTRNNETEGISYCFHVECLVFRDELLILSGRCLYIRYLEE